MAEATIVSEFKLMNILYILHKYVPVLVHCKNGSQITVMLLWIPMMSKGCHCYLAYYHKLLMMSLE